MGPYSQHGFRYMEGDIWYKRAPRRLIYVKGRGVWSSELDTNLSPSSATYWLCDFEQANFSFLRRGFLICKVRIIISFLDTIGCSVLLCHHFMCAVPGGVSSFCR